ncbi:MAG: helix-turn-helix transcriptional regulator [Clostridiaceae bacterium]|nr:helix-turn-helix transcriptional regulator [Clostridiaceae bacterium]
MLQQKTETETQKETRPPCTGEVACSIEKALDVLGGKWTFLIIRDLFEGTRRFGELRTSLGNVSPKTLSARLRDLEKKHIVTREAFATIPPTVQYSLTEKGRSLKPIIKAMKVWGATWGQVEDSGGPDA